MTGRTNRRILALAGIAMACGLAMWVLQPPGKPSQLWKVPPSSTRLGPALDLDQYHVVLEGAVISGIKENLSGLTYNPERHTLFGVINKPASLAEISLNGRLLQLTRLRGFKDTEGVTYLGNNRFAVVEEYKHGIRTVSIDLIGGVVPHSQDPELIVGEFPQNNTGLEGIGYDYKDSLYVVKEIFPAACYRVKGVSPAFHLPPKAEVVKVRFDPASSGLEDLSSIECDYTTGNLLILSQKSKRALEVTPAGEVVSAISLEKGEHGLKAAVPQPEGIASDRNGRLYIVSEPNLLYVFARREESSQPSTEDRSFHAAADPGPFALTPR